MKRLAIAVLAGLVGFAIGAITRATGGPPPPVPLTAPPTLARVLAANDWLNAHPTSAEVRGKVVLLDFYTFLCYNCQNTEPNLRALHRTLPSSDFVILSVHCPETPYEADRAKLIASLKEQGIAWPVAVDNNFAIWHAYGVEAWPTQMIFDRHGVLRKTVVGDSQDQIVDTTVKELLAER